MHCVAGLPAEVPRRAGGGHAQAGRAGEEDRASRGRLQTLLGGAQGGTAGTQPRGGREGELSGGLAARSLKGSARIYLKGALSRDAYF